MTIPTSISGFPRIGRDRELKRPSKPIGKAMPRSTMCVRPAASFVFGIGGWKRTQALI